MTADSGPVLNLPRISTDLAANGVEEIVALLRALFFPSQYLSNITDILCRVHVSPYTLLFYTSRKNDWPL